MKTWLKGGLIGAGIFALLLLFLYIFRAIFWGLDAIMLSIITLIPNLMMQIAPTFWDRIVFIIVPNGISAQGLSLFLEAVIVFVLGSIIGLIIQKVKSKNSENGK